MSDKKKPSQMIQDLWEVQRIAVRHMLWELAHTKRDDVDSIDSILDDIDDGYRRMVRLDEQKTRALNSWFQPLQPPDWDEGSGG